MSGGSWEYVYTKFEEVADQLEAAYEADPHRQMLAAKIREVAKAMHDIEWVDSCDYAKGDEKAAIERACGGATERNHPERSDEENQKTS